MLIAALPAERKILELTEGSLALMGYETVRIVLRGNEKNKTLQIMIDRADGAPITVDDCAAASGQISAVLDVHDPIEQRYRLEVSSPGLDRPLTRLKDFKANIGRDILAEARSPLEDTGRKKWRGVLRGADEMGFDIEPSDAAVPGSLVKVPYAETVRVKLVLTNALLEEFTAKLNQEA